MINRKTLLKISELIKFTADDDIYRFLKKLEKYIKTKIKKNKFYQQKLRKGNKHV